ncbi:IQ domain-containing protein IQM2-like [Typha latifolia]|uniref:IQ domain-containing protein IQM2-like n=1 Tax=Typha latifolia TaxID=4733 RepID=UPI003C2FC5F2
MSISLLDERFESLLRRSFSFGDTMKTTLRSVSFNGRDAEHRIVKAFGSSKLIIKRSLSFNRKETDPFYVEPMISIKNPSSEKENSTEPIDLSKSRFSPLKEKSMESRLIGPDSSKHQAAVKLQKVYKSFRTRRQLADCAVLAEQHWWKLLDFALLKRSSVSFFNFEKPESAVSKWSRARMRAAKVGKGLSKDDKAQKLALQHWLEAIDPRHRYGHNLHYYYDCWLHCESKQPFFYWLDVGEGKEVNVEEHCPRLKLQQQCIKYLGPKEREAYEVIVEDGKFIYKQCKQLLDTYEGSKDAKWIFVLSTSKILYVGQKKKGKFQHSSFLAGGATSAAGRLIVENGLLKAVWPHSGHYRPTEENFQEFMSFLKENNVDLTYVKLNPTGEDEDFWSRFGSSRFELNFDERNISDMPKDETESVLETKSSSPSEVLGESLISISSAEPKDLEETDEEIEEEIYHVTDRATINSLGDDETVEDSSSKRLSEYCKQNLFEGEQEDKGESSLPQELILRRINSRKGMKSYQLGKQLSFKWTTGAGPRIGCVRDYPSELQFRALEQVSLSPRTAAAPPRFSSPRYATSTSTEISSVIEQ